MTETETAVTLVFRYSPPREHSRRVQDETLTLASRFVITKELCGEAAVRGTDDS